MERDEKYYDLICATDPINPIRDLLRSGQMKFNEDFKIELVGKRAVEREWLNAAHDDQRKCGLWHTIYFSNYKIIPSGCQNCWKCCLKVRSLEDLFKVREFQLTNLAQPAKCGLEKRGYTANLGRYSAYWYCDMSKGLKGARALWTVLNEKLISILGKDHGLILKRACTEMELHTVDMGMGGSDRWGEYSDKWNAYEEILNHIFIYPDMKSKPVPWWIEKNIERRWIEWAYEYGDPTYIKYTGVPLTRPLEYYHKDSVHSHTDFRSTYDRIIPLNGTIEGEKEDARNEESKRRCGTESGRDGVKSGGNSPLVSIV